MKKGVLVVMCLLACGLAFTQAQTVAINSFSGSGLPAGWKAASGDWQVRNGALWQLDTKERMAIHWLAKASLFKRPFGLIMRWLGGIPVERSRRSSLVDTAVAAFKARPGMVLGISPEGSRGRVDHWKSGFYRIAQGAGVPVVPGFLDFGAKIGGAGAPIEMTGSPEVDLPRLRAFYEKMKGRNADLFDPESIRLRPARA